MEEASLNRGKIMKDRFCGEQFDNTIIWRLLLVFCSIALIITANDALATATDKDPVGTVFCNLVKIFRGNTARGIAIVGVVVLGIQTLRGQLKWEVALIIVTGIIILFKAPDIVDMVAGTNTAASKCGTTTIGT